MKKWVVFFLVCLLSASVFSQQKQNAQYLLYIDKYKDIAIEEMRRYNIPASITLAQGILESSAGNSELCRKGNNHFGIKCHGWTSARVYHDDDESNECFRAYGSALESYEDHSKFLSSSSRYSRLFKLSRTDYKGWAHGLKECGYATNPQYAQILINLIQLYKLYEYDTGASQQSRRGSFAQQTDGHQIRIYNKTLYVVARRGDTFRSIAKETGISFRKLAKYNERNPNDKLDDGDIVYLKKKQKRADKAFKKTYHTAQRGESLYSISQRYGIRLRSLYKMNHLTPDYQLRVGDRLKVY